MHDCPVLRAANTDTRRATNEPIQRSITTLSSLSLLGARHSKSWYRRFHISPSCDCYIRPPAVVKLQLDRSGEHVWNRERGEHAEAPAMNPLDLANLGPLMEITRGSPEVRIGLIDGPVAFNHPGLSAGRMRELSRDVGAACTRAESAACLHGTFVAGILSAERGASAPAICPDCTLLVRPIFGEFARDDASVPSATADELAVAVQECIDARVHVVNLSLALASSSTRGEQVLRQALDWAAQQGVVVVAAAGNQRTVGSSPITRHSWVIPVAACDSRGAPLGYSNLGRSIGRNGLSAPGQDITSLGADGRSLTFSGTSVAAPFVTGAIALMWSACPGTSGARVKIALALAHKSRTRSVTPPLLNAWRAYVELARMTLRPPRDHALPPATSAWQG